MNQDWKPVIFNPSKKNINKTVYNRPRLNDEQIRQRKIDNEEFIASEKTISKEVSVKIRQTRNSLGLMQKQLASKIYEPLSVVTDYENGKAIPTQKVLIKLEKALNVKLRGNINE